MADFIIAKPLAKPRGMRLDPSGAPPPVVSLSLDSLPHVAGAEPLDGVVLDGVLAPQECEQLVDAAEASGGFGWWDPSGDRSADKVAQRNADTLEFDGDEEALCAALWERMRAHVPARVEITPKQSRYERDLEGCWEAAGLNAHLLINRYASGGHFAPHADGSTIVDFNTRSLYTVLIYLNDVRQGGATQLLSDEQREATTVDGDTGARLASQASVVHAVAPVAGRTLVYWHEVMHAGEPVGDGCVKYCIRSDVMYRRTPAVCAEPHDLEAFELFQRARELEASGKPMEAVPLLRRAARISPGIKAAYRL